MQNRLSISVRLYALSAVLLFLGLVWLYTREFPVFSNTIGIRTLVAVSCLVGALAGSGIVYALRHRLTPWDRHIPEIGIILAFPVIFAPLFGSLINRAGGSRAHQSFEFISEQAFVSSNYGLLKGEKIKPAGYSLYVKEGDRVLRFQYKSQAYYPITRRGETVLLPVRTGLLGFRVMELR